MSEQPRIQGDDSKGSIGPFPEPTIQDIMDRPVKDIFVSTDQAPQSPVKRMARLTVVEHVYHEPTDSEGTDYTRSYQRVLKTDEVPFTRPRFITHRDWQPLETGWVRGAGHLYILNDEQPSFQKMPSPEERAEVGRKIIEVGVLPMVKDDKRRTMHSAPAPVPDITPCWLIPPGETLRATPADVARLYLRCPAGPARCTIVVIPE